MRIMIVVVIMMVVVVVIMVIIITESVHCTISNICDSCDIDHNDADAESALLTLLTEEQSKGKG